MSTPPHDAPSHDAPSHDTPSPAAPVAGGTFRRLFVLAVALGMMTGLSVLRADSAGGASDPMTLAAIGFVLLAAFTVGELGAVLGLPKVTGYIVAGVALGPQAANILSDRVVGEMGTFNTLALGLIATTAGLELHLPAIRKVGRTLVATVGLKVLLLPIFVGVPLALAERFVPSFGLAEWGPIAALALVISVLGIGTSPAIALAVVNDAGSKGRLTDLLLGIAVVKDLVVVTCLAIAIAVSRSLLGGDAMDASVLTHLAAELGGSVAVGAVVGGLLILYFRFVRVEPLFSVLVTILLVAELSALLHLELLLVFITAGFLVRNVSEYEHELLHPLERISLPVFVVFFTTAGAGVDLRGTLAILPLALTLVGLRAAAYAVAGRLGARIGGESHAVGGNAWLTYLPQAGVTLGLVLLAAKALPALEGPITRLGLALVTLNLLIGPVTLGLGLGRAGETRAAREKGAPEPTAPAADAPPGDRAEAPAAPPARPSLAEPALAEVVAAVEAELGVRLDAFDAGELAALSAALEQRATALLPDEPDHLARIRRVRLAPPAPAPLRDGTAERAAATLFDTLSGVLQTAPWTVDVETRPALLAPQPGDPRGLAARKALARVSDRLSRLRSSGSQRHVPVQLALRAAVEPRLAEALVTVTAGLHRTEAVLLALARRGFREDAAPVHADAVAVVERWRALAAADLRRAVRAGLDEAVGLLATLDSPAAPARSIRYAEVEPRVVAALTRLGEDAPGWSRACACAEDGLRASAFAATSGRRLSAGVDLRARQPLRAVRDAVLPELSGTASRMRELAEQASALTPEDLGGDAVERIGALCTEALTRTASAGLRRATARFRRQTRAGLLVRDVTDILQNTPERSSALAGDVPLERATRPGELEIVEIPLARLVEAHLHDDLLPSVAGALGPVTEVVAACEGRVREAAAVAGYGAHLAARGGFESDEERKKVLVEAIERGERRVRQLHEELVSALEHAETALGATEQRTIDRLHAHLAARSRGQAALVRHTLRATLADLGAQLATVRAELEGRGRGLVARARALAQDKNVRDLRIRSGRERLDATAMRAYVDAHLATVHGRALPAAYVRSMAPAPVSERRMFVGREAELERLLDGLSPEPREAAPSTLVVGPEGAGCSSLVQMVQMQLVGPRVISLDSAFSSRSDGPVGALATELGSPSEPDLVREALQTRPTVVLLDAAERWLEPGDLGVAALTALLDLVAATTPQTRWLVTMGEPAFSVYDEALGLRHRLSRVMRLAPLDGAAIQELVERRARQGGFDQHFNTDSWRDRLRERVRPGRTREDYFAALSRAARGNPGDALRIHLSAARSHGPDALRLGQPVLPALPVVTQLSTEALAILVTLMRFGPLDCARLARALGLHENLVASHLAFLLHAGMTRPHGQVGGAVEVGPSVVASLRRELEDMGLLTWSTP